MGLYIMVVELEFIVYIEAMLQVSLVNDLLMQVFAVKSRHLDDLKVISQLGIILNVLVIKKIPDVSLFINRVQFLLHSCNVRIQNTIE